MPITMPKPSSYPVRVTLRPAAGEAGTWHYEIVDSSSSRRHGVLRDPDPRAALEVMVSDLVFEALTVDADVVWTSDGHGEVVFREADPGRTPGRSPAFALVVVPGQGVLLPEPLPPLLLDAPKPMALSALAAAAETLGIAPPEEALGIGLGIQMGRGTGLFALCADYLDPGTDRVAEITIKRGRAWRGSHELRAHQDGVDLFADPRRESVKLTSPAFASQAERWRF
jgi:hypothetical protein